MLSVLLSAQHTQHQDFSIALEKESYPLLASAIIEYNKIRGNL
jgi:hypothetical protein